MIPTQIIQLMRGNNPQQVLLSMLRQQSSNNPMLGNVVQMIEKNDRNGLEQLARNLANERGINVDDVYRQLEEQFNITRN